MNPSESPYYVHPTAIVEEGALIGKGTKIWHFSHLMPNSVIGERCQLGQNVYVGRGVRLGSGVKIQNNVSVYESVKIEDDVFCGPSMVFTNVINPRSFIERKAEFKTTRVRKGATIGANATIICGIELGEYCMIGAGATVTKNVPAYALMVGVPARRVGWVCRCGVRLHDQAVAHCRDCGATYHIQNGQCEPRNSAQPTSPSP